MISDDKWSGSCTNRHQRDRKFGESTHAVNSWPLFWHARSGSVCLPSSLSHRLTHLSAASDVDRMCVTRDQDGVSAMWSILITSINTRCEFITCLLLETRMPWARSVLVLRSSAKPAIYWDGPLKEQNVWVMRLLDISRLLSLRFILCDFRDGNVSPYRMKPTEFRDPRNFPSVPSWDWHLFDTTQSWLFFIAASSDQFRSNTLVNDQIPTKVMTPHGLSFTLCLVPSSKC